MICCSNVTLGRPYVHLSNEHTVYPIMSLISKQQAVGLVNSITSLQQHSEWIDLHSTNRELISVYSFNFHLLLLSFWYVRLLSPHLYVWLIIISCDLATLFTNTCWKCWNEWKLMLQEYFEIILNRLVDLSICRNSRGSIVGSKIRITTFCPHSCSFYKISADLTNSPKWVCVSLQISFLRENLSYLEPLTVLMS